MAGATVHQFPANETEQRRSRAGNRVSAAPAGAILLLQPEKYTLAELAALGWTPGERLCWMVCLAAEAVHTISSLAAEAGVHRETAGLFVHKAVDEGMVRVERLAPNLHVPVGISDMRSQGDVGNSDIAAANSDIRPRARDEGAVRVLGSKALEAKPTPPVEPLTNAQGPTGGVAEKSTLNLPRGPVADALSAVFGVPKTRTEAETRWFVWRELKTAGATPEQVPRYRRYCQEHLLVDALCTDMTLVRRWGQIDHALARRTSSTVVCPDCKHGGGRHLTDCSFAPPPPPALKHAARPAPPPLRQPKPPAPPAPLVFRPAVPAELVFVPLAKYTGSEQADANGKEPLD